MVKYLINGDQKVESSVNCFLALCVWVFGVVFFLGLIHPFTRLPSLSTNIVDIFILACISSGTSYILDKIVGDDGIRLEKR